MYTLSYYGATDQKIINQKCRSRNLWGGNEPKSLLQVFLEIHTDFEDCSMMVEGEERRATQESGLKIDES